MAEQGRTSDDRTANAALIVSEDLGGVQGTKPNDAQDAAIASGEEPEVERPAPFVGGGEIDWAELGQSPAPPAAADPAAGPGESRFRDVDDDTLLDMFDHAHDVGDEYCDAIAAELHWRGIEVAPCPQPHAQ